MTHPVNLELSRGLDITSATKRTVSRAFRHAGRIVVILLLFSVTPALAIQHGGGGGGHSSGGGGGHFGGGGHVGGGHPVSSGHPTGGGQHVSASHPPSAPAPHSGTTAVATGHPAPAPGAPGTSAGARPAVPATHVAEPGYIWEASPYYSNRVGPAPSQMEGKRAFIWEEPGTWTSVESQPSRTFGAAQAFSLVPASNFRGSSSRTAPIPPHSSAIIVRRGNGTITVQARSARIIQGRRRVRTRPIGIGFFPFGFFPGFFFGDCFNFGYWYWSEYGFNPFGFDPCGFGYFSPYGYGGYPGYNFGSSDYVGVENQMPDFTGPSAPSEEPTRDEAVAPQSAEVPAPAPGVTVLYLKDGSSFGVTDYWLEGGRLHYVTTYGGANAMDMDDLDTQHTVDENAKQGVTFTLRPPHTQDQQGQPTPQPKPQQ